MTARSRNRLWPTAALVLAATFVLAGSIVALDQLGRRTLSFEMRMLWRFAAQGTGSALLVLAAAWVIWGAGKLVTRLALSLASVVAILMLWHVLYHPRRPEDTFLQHLATLATWAGALVLLASAWHFGIRVVGRREELAADPRKWQLSLLDLLSLMSAMAILLAGLRWFIPKELIVFSLSGEDIFWMSFHVGSTLLVVSTIVTCYHEPRAWWLNLAISSAFVATIALLHVFALGRSERLLFPPLHPQLAARLVDHAVLFGWLLGGVAALDAAGFRLRRCFRLGVRLPLAEDQATQIRA